jgi:hypothetical protein
MPSNLIHNICSTIRIRCLLGCYLNFQRCRILHAVSQQVFAFRVNYFAFVKHNQDNVANLYTVRICRHAGGNC